MKFIEALATILTIAGFFMLSEGMLVAGFATSFAANILWIMWAYNGRAWGILVVNSALIVSSTNGLLGNL